MKNSLKFILAIALTLTSGYSHAQLSQWYGGKNSVFESEDIYGNTIVTPVRGYDTPLNRNGSTAEGLPVLLYPNPVRSQARIELPYASYNSVYVDVIDLRGQIMRSYNYAPGSTVLDIDMSTMPTGIYNMRVIEDRVIKNVRVVKE